MAERNRTVLVGRDGEDHLDLTQAVVYTGVSRVTLMRRIADGRLPSQIVNGKHRVSSGDLDALFGPAPVLAGARTADDSTLRLWAKRVAEAAPPLRPEQRDVVLSAFADALITIGGE
ncbi:hypothetical protein FB468_0717 [Leucobacter komagatae]|uniref:Helix-turn-helix domain-containing protein n=2 Tax=Leucobacter TaxID=55968 RepID=A0A939M032_9MICO|nr:MULTISPECIES: helix-turn-helix domain-containing protein [Leucobacter]MBO1804600.1 helix-turn-helix domain-containing protein [Leucobacter ruminantium]TQL42712.1 hypothetical protein FB468_0717 [Leucobacter komagatae]